MNQNVTRRRLLSLSVAGSAGLLGACTVIHAGGSTTAILDVARIVTDSKAILSALSAALMVASLVTALGANLVLVQAALLAAQATLSEIESLGGGSVSVAVDTSRIQALVVSLLGDVQTILTLVQAAAVSLTGPVARTIAAYLAAVLALMPIVQGAAGLSTLRDRAPVMSESQALAIARGGA